MFVVSGYMRSGTSMMMDALSAGGRPKGLRCEWSRERDEGMNRKTGDENYRGNESYREINMKEIAGFNYPLKYKGCLIKVLFGALREMRATPHRVVFMIRDPQEIAESYERLMTFVDGDGELQSHPLMETINGMSVPVTELEQHCGMSWPVFYMRRMKQVIIQHETRSDCHSFIVMKYKEVLENPLHHFRLLESNGWPIVPEIAAAVVNPKRKRVTA